MMKVLQYRLTMMTAVLAAVFSAYAYASPNSDFLDSIHNQLTLQEVEVLGERSDAGMFPFVDSEIRIQDLPSLPVQTMADIIKYSARVDVRARGTAGAQADVSMRGGTFDQVRILLNGIDITDAQTGHYSLNVPVPVDLIDRIVVQGNTINIITLNSPSVEKGLFSLRFTTGMNGLLNPAVATRHKWNDVYLNASAEYNRSDGYYAPNPSKKEQVALDNSDLHLANIYLQTGYKGLDVQLGAQYKDAGAGMFYGFGSQDQFDATRTGFAAARYMHRWKAWQLEANTSYRANYDHYEWHRGQPLGSNTHFSQITGALMKGSYTYRLGQTSLGVEMRNENLHSSNMGDHNRLNVNYFAEQNFNWNGLHAHLDVHGNYNTMFGHDLAGKAKIGYVTRPYEVFMKANRSFRLPTFTDLYYDAGNQLGNPDLKPEKAWTLALGGEFRSHAADTHGPLTVHAEAFYRWGWNIIDWVYTPTDLKRPYHAENQARVNAAGTEIFARYQFDGMYLRTTELSYAYTWLDLDVDRSGSRYLDYLSHKLVARIEHSIWRFPHSELCASWSLTWQKREGQFNTAKGDVANFRPVLLLDGQVFWEHRYVKVAVECTNLTNRHYYDYGGVLQPGAWAKMTVTARIR